MGEKIRIYLYFPVVHRWFTCDLLNHFSFHELFRILSPFFEKEMKGMYYLHEDMMVMEYTQDLPCDKDVSLLAAGVRTGMSFVIY